MTDVFKRFRFRPISFASQLFNWFAFSEVNLASIKEHSFDNNSIMFFLVKSIESLYIFYF